MEYDVVVWRDTLSDGSTCYAVICPAVRRAHGQGNTEAEALAEVADAICCFLEREPDRVKLGQAAQEALNDLLADLNAEGIAPWVRQVDSSSIPTPA